MLTAYWRMGYRTGADSLTDANSLKAPPTPVPVHAAAAAPVSRGKKMVVVSANVALYLSFAI